MTPDQHIYKYWEAWTINENGTYHRYMGLEVLPEGNFCILERQLHGGFGVGNDGDFIVLAVRTGLDDIRRGNSRSFPTIAEAITQWDIWYPKD
jgi:hypothetical protein